MPIQAYRPPDSHQTQVVSNLACLWELSDLDKSKTGKDEASFPCQRHGFYTVILVDSTTGCFSGSDSELQGQVCQGGALGLLLCPLQEIVLVQQQAMGQFSGDLQAWAKEAGCCKQMHVRGRVMVRRCGRYSP